MKQNTLLLVTLFCFCLCSCDKCDPPISNGDDVARRFILYNDWSFPVQICYTPLVSCNCGESVNRILAPKASLALDLDAGVTKTVMIRGVDADFCSSTQNPCGSMTFKGSTTSNSGKDTVRIYPTNEWCPINK